MSWFGNLFGVEEEFKDVHSQFKCVDTDKGPEIIAPNKKKFLAGHFETPTLKQLREQGLELLKAHQAKAKGETRPTAYEHLAVEGSLEAHGEAGSTFQVASQFNCLEFPGPRTLPENGITNYIYDRTQGPACAVACAPGTLYRNYFAQVSPGEEPGQAKNRQINNLDGLEAKLEESKQFDPLPWKVKNGYTDGKPEVLKKFNDYIDKLSADQVDALRDSIKIGVQYGTEVVFAKERDASTGKQSKLKEKPHLVSQCFCSALSVAYSGISAEKWRGLGVLVLEATYEATLWATLISHLQYKLDNRVVLTFVGGGVFGNPMSWITGSIARAIAILRKHNAPIHVCIGHYRSVDKSLAESIDRPLKGRSPRGKRERGE